MKLPCMVLILSLLAGCGGGGGGDSPPAPVAATPAPVTPVTPMTPVVTTPVVTTPVPATPAPVIPAPYTILPATISGTYVAGYPKTVSVTATQTVPFTGIAYIKLGSDALVLPNAPSLYVQSNGSVKIDLLPSATIAAGQYTGKVTVNVCSDPNCTVQLAGSPFQVPYDFRVDPVEGGTTAFNLKALSPLAGAPDWETFQGNASHTGYVPVTLNPADFSARWTWVAPAYQGQQTQVSTVTASGGRVFVANGAGWISQSASLLYALGEADGKPIWSHDFSYLHYPSINPPAVSNGKVYMSAGSQESTTMFGFDAATGTQLFASAMSSQWEKYLAPTIFDTTVYNNGGTYGGMYAFNKTSGAQVFFANNLGQYDGWTPAVDANNAYAYVGGSLITVDRRTGIKLGEISDSTYQWNGYTNTGAPVLGSTGSITNVNGGYAEKNALVNYNMVSQAVRWNVPGAYPGNPAFQGGTLFAINNFPFRLEARNETDGALLWSWAPPAADARFVGDVIVTNNLIFVSTSTTTYAIDRTSHAAAWSHPASGALALSANGILYIQSSPRIHAINVK